MQIGHAVLPPRWPFLLGCTREAVMATDMSTMCTFSGRRSLRNVRAADVANEVPPSSGLDEFEVMPALIVVAGVINVSAYLVDRSGDAG